MIGLTLIGCLARCRVLAIVIVGCGEVGVQRGEVNINVGQLARI